MMISSQVRLEKDYTLPCIIKLHCKVIPMFVIRRYHRLHSTWTCSSPGFTGKYDTILSSTNLLSLHWHS